MQSVLIKIVHTTHTHTHTFTREIYCYVLRVKLITMMSFDFLEFTYMNHERVLKDAVLCVLIVKT